MVKNNNNIKIGDKVIVFDSKLWGYKDKGDNSQFWKEAVVLSIEGIGIRQTATVRFEHDGRKSRGHFTHGIKRIKINA